MLAVVLVVLFSVSIATAFDAVLFGLLSFSHCAETLAEPVACGMVACYNKWFLAVKLGK